MTPSPSPERADLVGTLRKHRELFLGTVRDLSDDQARLTPTVSTLSLGGLVKHVTATESEWQRFIVDGPAGQPDIDWADIDWNNPPEAVLAYQNQFRLLEGETLADVVAEHHRVAEETERLIATVDLDATQPLPEAPWFAPGERWTARRTFLHLIAEVSQHAGHADIIREAVDGQKSMSS
ncbi:DinB family protein [Nocardioides sp. R-C-SC26]|uniref:DinB family protein n=1 Tax=Nocardioides sp. R-C-SC26 TaxID=2870414 RepID=UPI001E36D0FB|nr:DinB family protein [Nocardioides sp. R-C-SC26]